MMVFSSALINLKQATQSPLDVFERLLSIGLMAYVALVLGIFFLKRMLAWLDDRFWITYSGNVPTYGTLSNAFLEIQSIAQSEKQYVIELKEEEQQKKEHDDASGSGKSQADSSRIRTKRVRRRAGK